MIIDVAVPVRVFSSFHYLEPFEPTQAIELGSVVQVRFRNRETHAFVLGLLEKTTVDPKKLKAVDEVLVSEPLFDPPMLNFLKWIAEYYCHPLGEVIAVALPRACWMKKKAKKKAKETSKRESAETVAVSDARYGVHTEKLPLTEEQEAALKVILSDETKKPVLLHGVTGSGKTEVYMQALAECVRAGKTGIVLVPEIALTPQLMDRFSARFPGIVAVLHSELTDGERFAEWEKIRKGGARIVVGARSAVFAPVRDLGLIVVDEEHESSFKQEDSVRYHARDVAIVRAKMMGARVILGSATPSLESYYNAKIGKYQGCYLTKRIQERSFPSASFVDLRQTSLRFSENVPWLSRPLLEKMGDVLKKKQQTLLYLNRLGFAHFLFCQDCGHTWRCRSCDVALTYYKTPPSLKCHYCGVVKRSPSNCEECQGTKLSPMGLGTEQVEHQLIKIFPEARIERMDRSQIKTREELESLLGRVSRREIDIIIGTQMVTKGHDFPGISLVGILVADASLNIPDFRAQERTFQVITQVSGRAGRSEIPGEVIIQTINPDHPVLQFAAQNRLDDFYQLELLARKQFGFPPYRRLAMLKFQNKNVNRVAQFANETVNFIRAEATKKGFRIAVLGPSESPLSKLKDLFRWQCLVKSDSIKEMQLLLRSTQEFAMQKQSSVQFAVDVDPIHSL